MTPFTNLNLSVCVRVALLLACARVCVWCCCSRARGFRAAESRPEAVGLYEQILSTVIENVGTIRGEAEYLKFYSVVKELSENLPAQFAMSSANESQLQKWLKVPLSTQSSKLQVAMACQIICSYVSSAGPGCTSPRPGVHNLLEAMFGNIYLPNLRGNKKQVSNSVLLITSLLTMVTCSGVMQDSLRTEWLKSLSHLISANCMLTQHDFIPLLQQFERKMLLASLSRLIRRFGADLRQNYEHLLIVSKTWIFAFFLAEERKLVFQQEFEGAAEHALILFEVIALGLFIYAYFVSPRLSAEAAFDV